MSKFTHLHVHSHYSLLDGLSRIDDLVRRAGELGMDALALTDHGNMYGAVEFYQKAKKAGIKPIIGCELYVAYEGMEDKRPGVDSRRYHLTVIAKDNEGYKNLVKIVSEAHLRGFYYKPRVDKNLLSKYSKGLIAFSGCLASETSRAISAKRPEVALRIAGEYQEIFGRENFYLEMISLPMLAEQKRVNEFLVDLSKKINAKLVATADTHYIYPEDSEAQDILISVQTGNNVADEDRLTLKDADLSMHSPQQMEEIFSFAPEAVANTADIAARCNVELNIGKNILPLFPVPEGYTADSYLKKLCYDGLSNRYGINPAYLKSAYDNPEQQKVLHRLEYELEVIKKTGFASYFLIVQDFVNWAKRNGIVVGPGRGSAAGSLVSYLLGITNIDPLKYNLLFERFLNPERISMPDIDLDFADVRRDDVIEYVAQKYGRSHTAQIITFGTMAARAAVRDTGRALGMSYSFCDRIAKLIPPNPQGVKTGWLAKCLENVLELRQEYDRDPEVKRLIDAAMRLEGVVRHASTHACGVVISPRPLDEDIPLQYSTRHSGAKNDSNNQVVVTQYEMRSIEALGLLKMDFLGLRNLTIIENTINLVRRLHGIDIDIDKIPLDDKKTFQLFQRGETTGLFQFESSGMKRYLRELKPTELEDLIAMVALYRPGPMELIPSFIARKHGKERVTYLHPKLEPILKNTYGIGVYQEQMMQIARDLAGFTLPEADTLRKAIGKKIKDLLDQQKEKLINGMIKNGIPERTAKAIWELFPPFARYGFNRSHAACYALIAYQTGYLKAHYPTEFMTALLTAEGGEVEKVAFFVQEARAMGIEVLPPDINESFEEFTVVGSGKIRFGLGSIKNVGANIVNAIVEERSKRGRFSSITDFVGRVRHRDLNKKSLEALIKCGALDALGERQSLLKNLDVLLEYNREQQKNANSGQESLFGSLPQSYSPTLRFKNVPPADKRTKLKWEKELLGMYITEHPIREYLPKLESLRAIPLSQITRRLNDRIVVTGGIVSGVKKIVTKSGQPMLFVKIEDLTTNMEVLVFPKVLEKKPTLWQEEKILCVRGRVSDKDGIPKILCEEAVEIA